MMAVAGFGNIGCISSVPTGRGSTAPATPGIGNNTAEVVCHSCLHIVRG
ncbi:MAG: hypothetical protein Q9M82_03295 [Mariprofundus sp.]|nr:hypothetical protein [Mariprofundus sp.]